MTPRRDVLEDLEDEPIRYPLAHGLTALLYLRAQPAVREHDAGSDLDPWDEMTFTDEETST